MWGGSVDSVGAPPYWPWRQVLRAVGNGIDQAAIAAEHRLTTDLARLAPDILDGSADLADTDGSMEDRFRLFDAVAVLLRQLTCRHRC